MTLFWSPDTCFCAFYLKDDFSAIQKIIQRCKLHKDTAENILLRTVQSFNNSYNNKLSKPTKEEVLASMKEKYDKKMTTKNDIC